MTTLFDMFETSDDLEKDGLWLKFGPSKVLLARSGGGNTAWYKELENQVKKVGKSTFDGLDTEEKVNIIRNVFCKAVIRDHKIKDEDGNWVSGVYVKEGNEVKTVDFNPENMSKCLEQLPEYFKQLQEWADDYKTFRSVQIKGQEKNS